MSLNQSSRWLLAGLLLAGSARATSLGQASTPAGASYASACAGLGFAGGGNAGDNVARIVEGSNNVCTDQTSAVGGSVSTSVSDSGVSGGVSFSNDAHGSAVPLSIHHDSSNTGAFQAAFPGGEANAGWSDQITLTAPGMSGTGVWVVSLNVDGSMSAVGLGADGILSVAAFENKAFIQQYGGATNLNAYNTFLALDTPVYRGSPSGSSWDFENVQWRVDDYGLGDPETLQTLNVNDTISFAIPFTWGTPFDIGFFANVAAGELASGAGTTPNAASLDFHNTVSWGGPGYVVTDSGAGPKTTTFTISSLTGADYGAAFGAAPEPATWTTMLVGLGLAGAVMRRRRGAIAPWTRVTEA
jgi:hypothetical protein